MFIIAASSDKLALNTAGNAAFATLLYGVLIGNMALSSVLSALTLPLSLLGAILATRMAAKKGNKYALTYWSWFAIAFAAVGAVVYAVVPLNGVFKSVVPTVLFALAAVFRLLGQNGASACTTAMLADVTDYEASRSGKDIRLNKPATKHRRECVSSMHTRKRSTISGRGLPQYAAGPVRLSNPVGSRRAASSLLVPQSWTRRNPGRFMP